LRTQSLPASLNWLCGLAALAASLDCGVNLSWSNVGAGAGSAGVAGGAGATSDADGAAGAAGDAAGAAGTAGRADAGGASAGAAGGAAAAGGQGEVGGAQVEYAGTIVSPMSAANEVLFRRIDPPSGVCVLVDVLIQAGGQISGPRSAYALQTDRAGCLTATTANHVMATGSTGTITSSDGGVHFYIDLGLSFPAGTDWLGGSVSFKVPSVPLDGVWHTAP
jgi:hypothetical protein